MTIHRRRRRLAEQWPTILWLAVVWVMLWGSLTWGNVLAGIGIALFVTVLMPLPTIDFHGRVRPLGILVLLLRFFWELVVASVEVSLYAFRFGSVPRGAVVGVKLRSSSDLYLTLVAEISSLVPGSLVIEAHRNTGMLYLHVLDIASYGGPDRVREHTLELEARVMRALASDDELARAGVATTRRGQAALDAERAAGSRPTPTTEASS